MLWVKYKLISSLLTKIRIPLSNLWIYNFFLPGADHFVK